MTQFYLIRHGEAHRCFADEMKLKGAMRDYIPLTALGIKGGPLTEEEIREVCAGIPMNRVGKASEVAETIAFLASEEASYITGEDIDINGGSYMD